MIVEMGIPSIRCASVRMRSGFVGVRRIGLCTIRVSIRMRAISVTLAIGVTITVTGRLQPNNIG
jgi:hypothetical protein